MNFMPIFLLWPGVFVSLSISRLHGYLHSSLPSLMILGKHRTNCIETPDQVGGKSDNLCDLGASAATKCWSCVKYFCMINFLLDLGLMFGDHL